MDNSDEELQFINDVAFLNSQLKQAGCPCDENLHVHLFRGLHVKPLAKRLIKAMALQKRAAPKISGFPGNRT
jgi:hypothetical protein